MGNTGFIDSLAKYITWLFIVSVNDEFPETHFLSTSTKYACISSLALCVFTALSVPLLSMQYLALSFLLTILAASASAIYTVIKTNREGLKAWSKILSKGKTSIAISLGRFVLAIFSALFVLMVAAHAQQKLLIQLGEVTLSAIFLIVTFMNISAISYGVSVLVLSLAIRLNRSENDKN